MAVTIRRLVAADRDQWGELFDGYIRFYAADVPADVIEHTFQNLLSQAQGTHTGFVAVDESGQLVGLAHVLFHASTWSRTGYLYLEDLFVAPHARSQGIGAALIAESYREADRLGATRTYWATQEDNLTARALYDRMASRSPFIQYRR